MFKCLFIGLTATDMGPASYKCCVNSKILLVDDDPSNLRNVARFLRGEGYEVDEAGGGNEALQFLDQASYDLVLSDVSMPDLDGFHLIAQTLSIAPEVPFLLMSGFSNICPDQMVKRRVKDFILKPLDLDELLSKVKRALDAGSHP